MTALGPRKWKPCEGSGTPVPTAPGFARRDIDCPACGFVARIQVSSETFPKHRDRRDPAFRPALTLGDFSLHVDSYEDLCLECLACCQEIGNGSGTGNLPRLQTLADAVVLATEHRCAI